MTKRQNSTVTSVTFFDDDIERIDKIKSYIGGNPSMAFIIRMAIKHLVKLIEASPAISDVERKKQRQEELESRLRWMENWLDGDDLDLEE